MLNGYKIVGVCVTKLQDEFCSEFLDALNSRAIEAGYRLLVFNSFVDFYGDEEYQQGAKSVYKMINYDILDALVIEDECFYIKNIVRELVGKARDKGIPVVVLYGGYDGCFRVEKNYSAVFKELISHVINVHNARRLYFIAGNEGEPNSDLRLQCFREVMKENGLDLPEKGVAYCDYWEVPVHNAIDRWAEEKDLPDALICADDIMASFACDRLAYHGLKVPDDIIVTGFDGLKSLICREPRLTTCEQDISQTAEICFDTVRKAVEEKAEPCTLYEKYNLVFSESCGCRVEENVNYRENVAELYRRVENVRAQETKLYKWADRIQNSTDLNEIGRNLSENILPDSAVSVNSNLLFVARKDEEADPECPFTDKMVVISCRDAKYVERGQTVYDLSEMYPELSECISEKVMFVFQSIYAMSEVYGYYAAKFSVLKPYASMLHRLCRVTNLDFSIIIGRIKQENMITSIEKIQTRDALTGLLNLRGLVMFIDSNYEKYSKNSIVVSVYNIPRYKYIMENFGLEDAEEAVNMTAEALQLANPINAVVSRISEDEFIIANFVGDPEMIGEVINQATSAFFKITEEYNRKRDKDYFVEVNCGCVVSMPGWEKDIMSFIKAANGEMYLNRLKNGSTPALKQDKSKEEFYRLFDLLIEKNLFTYHFQPIVSARTGKIYAYEALMRTDSSINMNPAQIIDTANEYHRMYDVERATMFNVMGYVDSHTDEFNGKRVFINSIPGCFLKGEDYQKLVDNFGHLFNMCTIEITEQNETNDAELMHIKRLESGGVTCQLAIDDYGTGFSNIVNLLRYQPQVIKIDRYLVSDVHKDKNKQLFISSTVEFARLNDILVLAEGVETEEELSKVIELGVDLIQGYYTARPSANVISRIDDRIARFIRKESEKFFNTDKDIYKANDGEILNLSRIREAGCTTVEFDGGRYIISGEMDVSYDMVFVTAPETLNYFTFEDVSLAVVNGPALDLGVNSKNFIHLRGWNVLGGTQPGNEGIHVPSGAELTLNGEGDLSVISTVAAGVTLGGSVNSGCGSITVDMEGTLTVTATGDSVIGIGGGNRLEYEFINIVRGTVNVDVRGVHSVGIGGVYDGSLIRVGRDAEVDLFVIGNEGVALGSVSGKADIMSEGSVSARLEGEKITGIGVMNGRLRIDLASGSISSNMHGATAINIGSVDGCTDISCNAETVEIYAEGGKVVGIGNCLGEGTVTVKGGIIRETLRSASPAYIGGANDKTVICGGNIIIEGGTVTKGESPFGESLKLSEIADGGSFGAVICTEKGSYEYTASRHAETGKLCVYLPEGCEIKPIEKVGM